VIFFYFLNVGSLKKNIETKIIKFEKYKNQNWESCLYPYKYFNCLIKILDDKLTNKSRLFVLKIQGMKIEQLKIKR